MENKKLSVEAIENGTVIDHIPAGLGLTILRQFKLLHYGSAVTVGFNLPSKTQGSKDIIKISGVAFDDAAANRLALFAPEATVNTIADFKVMAKRHLTLPDEIAEVFRCPNANCASPGESPLLRQNAKWPNPPEMPLLRENIQPRFGGRGLTVKAFGAVSRMERPSENGITRP